MRYKITGCYTPTGLGYILFSLYILSLFTLFFLYYTRSIRPFLHNTPIPVYYLLPVNGYVPTPRFLYSILHFYLISYYIFYIVYLLFNLFIVLYHIYLCYPTSTLSFLIFILYCLHSILHTSSTTRRVTPHGLSTLLRDDSPSYLICSFILHSFIYLLFTYLYILLLTHILIFIIFLLIIYIIIL